jgi:hypothetical protein
MNLTIDQYSPERIDQLVALMTPAEEAEFMTLLFGVPQQANTYQAPALFEFARRTKIEVPQTAVGGSSATVVPFELWDSQLPVIEAMDNERLVIILKARQLGISWLACLHKLRKIVTLPNQRVLMFSQGEMEAGELIRRVKFLYYNHADREQFPAILKDNQSILQLANGSTIRSMAATKRAGRSFTASDVVLDEYAFMTWGADLFAAVKPTIDNGGTMTIISTADNYGSHYHQFWQAAERGDNSFKTIFLPWSAHPHRGEGWRKEREKESLYPKDVIREYPSNPLEAFVHATGIIYDVWLDDYDAGTAVTGNVTEEADYVPDGGEVYWAVDDGYSGRMDARSGMFTAESHPRVFLMAQMKADGHLDVFWEDCRVLTLEDEHIKLVLTLDYPLPTFAAVDKSAAQLKGRLHGQGVYTQNGPSSVEESIKETRRWIGQDENEWRRLRVHPRCKHMRYEMARYVKGEGGKPVKAFDHTADAIRYLIWRLRPLGD